MLKPSTHCLVYKKDIFTNENIDRIKSSMTSDASNPIIRNWLNQREAILSQKWFELSRNLPDAKKKSVLQSKQRSQFIYATIGSKIADTIWAINCSWYAPRYGKIYGLTSVGKIQNEIFKPYLEKPWFQCGEEFDSESNVIGIFCGETDMDVLMLVENGYVEDLEFTLFHYNPSKDSISEDSSYQSLTP